VQEGRFVPGFAGAGRLHRQAAQHRHRAFPRGPDKTRCAAGNDAGERAVHDISENHVAGLRAFKQSAVVGNVALDVPRWRQIVSRLRRGSEVKIYEGQIDNRGAIELSSRSDAEVRREDYLLPRTGTIGWRGELIAWILKLTNWKLEKSCTTHGFSWGRGTNGSAVTILEEPV
jgi:hypothetical protein